MENKRTNIKRRIKKTKNPAEQEKRLLNYRGLKHFTDELFKRVK